MKTPHFEATHINAVAQDLAGNHGIGRYIFLPGSDGRAKEIAKQFDNMEVKSHPRGHNLYLGTLTHEGHTIDVAAIASGMGCPSMEIILHELFHLGAKRFLRVGTAGSLQPGLIDIGHIINTQAAVRDESTTLHYAPIEVPAIASLEFISAILLAASKMGLADDVLHTGLAHCKSALYAREFAAGPKAAENEAYLKLLTDAGVLASEMETATLFIQSQIYNHQLALQDPSRSQRVLAGAILAIITNPGKGKGFEKSSPQSAVDLVVKRSIELALEAVKMLALQEMIG